MDLDLRFVGLQTIQDAVDVLLLLVDHGELGFLSLIYHGSVRFFESLIVSLCLRIRKHLLVHSFDLNIEAVSTCTTKYNHYQEKEAEAY